MAGRTPALRRLRFTALAALSLLFAGAAVSGATGSAAAAGHAPSAAPAAPDIEARVEAAGAKMPDVFGGLLAPGDGQQLVVYLTDVSPRNEQPFEQAAGQVPVTFRATSHSLAAVTSTHDDLQGRWTSLVSQGVDVVEFGPNIELGREDIGVRNLTPQAQTQLENRYGADMVHVYNVTDQEFASAQLDTTRINDYAPYNGGDAISDGTYGCTSGSAFTSTGTFACSRPATASP